MAVDSRGCGNGDSTEYQKKYREETGKEGPHLQTAHVGLPIGERKAKKEPQPEPDFPAAVLLVIKSALHLRSGHACGSQNTGNNLAEGLHENEEQYRIDPQGNDTFYKTDGEEILPFHAVHKMQP